MSSRSGASVAGNIGGLAAAWVDSKKERSQGINFPIEKRLHRVRVCEGVTMLVSTVTSTKRGHSRMMWVGECEAEPQGHLKVSGGSRGQKCAA